MNRFALSRISNGETTNLEIPVFCFKKVCAQLPSFFWNGPIYRQEKKPIWWKFCQCASELYHLFCIFSLSWTFQTNFFPVSIPKVYGVMHELYISWLGSYRQQMSNVMTANVACIVTRLYVTKKEKNIFVAPFYGWGSTGSRLKAPRGGSLLFTTKFPEIPGTHFINIRRMKGWVHLGYGIQCLDQ